MKILTERVIYKGELTRRILGFQNILQKKDLPKDYTLTQQYVVYYPQDVVNQLPPKIIVHTNSGYAHYLVQGELYHESYFLEILAVMKQAKIRYHSILSAIEKQKEEWFGKETIEL